MESAMWEFAFRLRFLLFLRSTQKPTHHCCCSACLTHTRTGETLRLLRPPRTNWYSMHPYLGIWPLGPFCWVSALSLSLLEAGLP